MHREGLYPIPLNKNGAPDLVLPTSILLLIKFSVSATISVFLPSSLASELKRSMTNVFSSLNSIPHSPAISLIGSPLDENFKILQ